MKKNVEIKVVNALRKEEYTLNTVNSYGENLLHTCAANGCLNIIKEILRKQGSCHVINRKNKFGWTPLMLAIRNKHVKTVKYLLEEGADVNESSYLGMSVLGLAAAVNKDMFEIVYKACSLALLNSMNDDVTPLCIAAMKNDKCLFFQLIQLGFDVSKANEYTHFIMKQSIVPEIKKLAKQYLDIENYWNDNSDNIFMESETNQGSHLKRIKNKSKGQYFTERIHSNTQNKYDNNNKDNINVPSLNISNISMFTFDIIKSDSDDCNNNITNSKKLLKPCTLSLTTNEPEVGQFSLVSPTLAYTLNEILPASPNIYFTQNKHADDITLDVIHNIENKQSIEDENEPVTTCSHNKTDLFELPLQRLQFIHPSDLNIQNEKDLNTTLGYIPEFSPLRSPNIPADINDENVFGENTPTPPRYKTPPRGMILNSEEAKMFVLLKRYGLSQHVPIFLEQEVDIDLFMTLTNDDLIEIGIKTEAERKAILDVIVDYKKSMV